MLVPAISKKTELEELFCVHLYDTDMFYYNGYPHCNYIPDLSPKENEYRWAIVDNNRVIGYFSYCVDVNTNCAYKFGLFSFERNNPMVGIDVYRKMKELVSTYRRIEWRMIQGCSAQRIYDKFCKRHNGNRVMLHSVTKDVNGKFRNEYIYEIYKE